MTWAFDHTGEEATAALAALESSGSRSWLDARLDAIATQAKLSSSQREVLATLSAAARPATRAEIQQALPSPVAPGNLVNRIRRTREKLDQAGPLHGTSPPTRAVLTLLIDTQHCREVNGLWVPRSERTARAVVLATQYFDGAAWQWGLAEPDGPSALTDTLVAAFQNRQWVTLLQHDPRPTELEHLAFGLRRPQMWTVDLAAASTAHEVADAVVAAMGAPSVGPLSTRMARIGAHLRRAGPGLLVLRHIDDVHTALGALLDDWLRLAPELRVLATSTLPARHPAEYAIRLRS